MIARITGELIEKKSNSLIIQVQGLQYEVLVPLSVLQRVDEQLDHGQLSLITHHYIQMSPSSASPMLVGFFNEIERDFFLQFIKVSGIGPRAAIKALNRPIHEIVRAIDDGDQKSLTSLPGIGQQKAKEIIAKLQGKVGRFGLIRDEMPKTNRVSSGSSPEWHTEALDVLLQLQYTRQEAMAMIEKVLGKIEGVNSAEELLNEIYKQRVR